MKTLLALLVVLPLNVFADDTESDDKTITVRKGAPSACIEFQIVEGSEEVFGVPDANKQKAYANWSNACEEWKKNFREMNKDNQVITAGCNRPKADKEDSNFVYRGIGLYKVKTVIRANANPR